MVNKFIFNHIPKSGGSSFRDYLKDVTAGQDHAVIFVDDINEIKNLNSVDKSICGHLDNSLVNYLSSGHLILSMVRHPISRSISVLNHSMRDPKFYGNFSGKSSLTLDEIISDDSFWLKTSNNMTKLFSGNLAFREFCSGKITELEYLDHYVEDIDQAIANVDKYDFIGIYENYIDSVNYIAYLIGSKNVDFMPWLNSFKNNTSVSDSLLEKFNLINQKDLVLYSYILDKYNSKLPFPKVKNDRSISISLNYFLYNLANDFNGSGWHSPEERYEKSHTKNKFDRWASQTQNIIIAADNLLSYLVLEVSFLNDSNNLKFFVKNCELDFQSVKTHSYTYLILNLDRFLPSSEIILSIFCDPTELLPSAGDDLRARTFILTNMALCDESVKICLLDFLELHSDVSPFDSFFIGFNT